ncbi:cytochrome P450, partial [Myxococcota bacterium]|nr:cytochrome P450 [Myxococcota bacterium]
MTGACLDQRPVTTAPIGGLAAARIYLQLLRDPLATFMALSMALSRDSIHGERLDPYDASAGPDGARDPAAIRLVAVPFRPRARRLVFAFGRELNRAILSDPETFRTTGQGLSGPRGSALRRVRNGLTRTRGEKHRRLRALLLAKLQRRAVDAMAPRIAAILEEQLAPLRPGQTIDLARETKALSLRISSEVLFGLEDRAQAARLGALLGEFIRGSYRLDVLATRWLGRIPGTPYAALERHAQALEREARSVIGIRRRASEGRDDLLTTLIEACDDGVGGLDDEDLVGQVTLLFGASYETTAQALLFSLALLAQSPTIVRRLRGAGGAGGARGRERGARSELVGFVVREALRLLPPVPYTIRIATRDVELAGVPIRRSDRVLVSHFHAHRIAECFPDPGRFDPERWRTAQPGPYDYFPFSAAPRLCIGAGFATEVLEQAVAAFVERFDFRLTERLAIEPAVRVTLGTRGPVPLVLGEPTGEGLGPARLTGALGRLIEAAGE